MELLLKIWCNHRASKMEAQGKKGGQWTEEKARILGKLRRSWGLPGVAALVGSTIVEQFYLSC
jgi:hypothetical protein